MNEKFSLEDRKHQSVFDEKLPTKVGLDTPCYKILSVGFFGFFFSSFGD